MADETETDETENTKQFEYWVHIFTKAYAYTYAFEYNCVMPAGTISLLWNWVV